MTPSDGAMIAMAALRDVTAGRVLPAEFARQLFDAVMEGAVETPLISGLLAALATRGEALNEVVAAAEAMRARMIRVCTPPGIEAIDTCGTGGDGKPTFNISTTAAIVAAAAGATVAKHGNRSHARPSGSAEGIAAIGVDAEAPLDAIERSLAEARIAFLFAPRLHPAMRHAAPARKALGGLRTIFNLLGPLTSPAGVKRQLIGVPRPELVRLMANALGQLGSTRALVVHGECGVCDLTLDGPTRVAELTGGEIREKTLTAEQFGLRPAPLAAIFVTSAAESGAVVTRVLAGEAGPALDTVLFNAAAALWAAGVVDEIGAGVAAARRAIESGSARQTLDRWRAICPLANGR